MQLGTFRYALCLSLLALSCQALHADDKTASPEPSVKRACESSQGATKKECEKVAAKMDAQASDPAAQPAADEVHSDSDYVHHSSPAVRSPEEVKRDKTQAKSERKKQRTEPAPK